MKTVFRIAKTELRTLFYSPIAWFLIIAFLFQCGLTYVNMLNANARNQEIDGRGLEYMMALTNRIFAGRNGVFDSVMEKLYFYIPLLTMGLISRETSSGTIKLLYTSPIEIWEIVIGKYVSMMIYSLLMVGVFGILIIAACFNIQHADLGMLFSAALGFYLLLCAYSAIGLFMSCLTTYQVVAALCTFITIGFLSYIGQLWQGIDLVRDLTYFLSLSGRTETMLGGLITSKDVLYFLLIIYIFLSMSIVRLLAEQESRNAAVSAGRYMLVVISALLLGYVTSRPRMIAYADMTSNHINTLTPNAQHIVKDLGKDRLEVTAYNNLLGTHYYLGLPDEQNEFMDIWAPYLRFKPDIDFKFVNYYDSSLEQDNMIRFNAGGKQKTLAEQANQVAKSFDLKISMFKTPEEIRKIVDLRPELNRFVLQLKYKNRTTFLRVYNDPILFPTETEVSAAFKRLQQAKLPKIGFLTGNFERSIYKTGDRDYHSMANEVTFRHALINQGFDTDTISPDTQDIPADITTLVIADPKTAFSPLARAKIQQYIDKGGNLLIAGEPGKQAVLNPLLQQLGVQLMEGILVQPSKDLSPDLVLPYMTTHVAAFTSNIRRKYEDSTVLSMPGATGLSYTADSGFNIKPLAMTDSAVSWMKQGTLVADSGDVVFAAQEGDRRGAFPTALALSRQVNDREQRIVVTGDADFISIKELARYNPRQANFLFSTALFSWLDNGAFPIDTSRPPSRDNRVNITTDGVDILRVFLVWILPAAVTIFATILLLRRKRK